MISHVYRTKLHASVTNPQQTARANTFYVHNEQFFVPMHGANAQRVWAG